MINFLLGILFICVVLPICESITSTICVGIEVIKAKFSVKITEYNSKISQLDGPMAHPIGFQYTSIEEDGEYEN